MKILASYINLVNTLRINLANLRIYTNITLRPEISAEGRILIKNNQIKDNQTLF